MQRLESELEQLDITRKSKIQEHEKLSIQLKSLSRAVSALSAGMPQNSPKLPAAKGYQ